VTPGLTLGTIFLRRRYFAIVRKRRHGVACDGSKGGNSLDAVTPGETLGALYSSGVGTNKTKQRTAHATHRPRNAPPTALPPALVGVVALMGHVFFLSPDLFSALSQE